MGAGRGVRLAAAAAAALDFASNQRACGGTEDRPGGAFAAGVDRTTDQRAAGCANDQAGGAVGALAAQATLRIAPRLAVIAIVMRQRGGRHQRDREGRGSHCQKDLTQRKFPGLFVFSSSRFRSTCMNVRCEAMLG